MRSDQIKNISSRKTHFVKKTTYYGRVWSNDFCNFSFMPIKKDPYGVLWLSNDLVIELPGRNSG